MFKTDDASLEKLSFTFTEQDIARFRRLLELLKMNDLGAISDEESTRLAIGLDRIGGLKLNGKVYAFYVEDTYASKQGGDSGEGVELYMRRGNRLEEYQVNFDRNWVLKVDQVVPKLKEDGISTIYTGNIPAKEYFLGIPAESDPEDPMYRSTLNDHNIAKFEASEIHVVKLEHLI